MPTSSGFAARGVSAATVKVTSNKSDLGVDIQGLDNAPVSNVVITNSTFDNVAKGNVVKNLKGSTVENFKINGKLVTSL